MRKIYNNIKYMLRESLLEAMHLAWRLIPYKKKIAILNLARTFYHRHNPLLGEIHNIGSAAFVGDNAPLTIKDNPMVSVIIPTFNNPYRLRDCLGAIKKNTQYKNYEVILVDNNTFDKKSLEIMDRSGHKVLKYSYKFNFSKINNFAARHAKGEYLLFLNDDTVPLKNWLEAMLNECQKEGVGIVGSKLLFYNNTIQHAGMNFDAKNLSFVNTYQHQPSCIKEANYIKAVPAVTGACMMLKKSLFEQAGGFDEEYWVESQDVDLCFKVRKLGLKVIYTSYSVLYHREGASRGRHSESPCDSFRLRKKWLENQIILNFGDLKRSHRHRILLIKLLTIGDVVMVTSVIDAVRKKYPQSEIVFATNYLYRDLVEGNPHLDKVYVCREYNPDEFDSPLTYYKAVTLEFLYKESWDLVYQIQILDLLCGHWGTDYHLRDLYADLANVKIKDEKAYIPLADTQRSKVYALLNTYVKDKQKIILLHTTSGWKLKDWDYKKYSLLIERIRDKYDIAFFQIGADKDIAIEDNNIVHLEGKLTLKETAALMERSSLLVCPDSGPMHMASAVGLAVIALFGPTSPATVGPINGSPYICIQSDTCCDVPCHMKRCYIGKDCAKDTSVDIVLDAINVMFKRDKDITQSWWRNNIYEGIGRGVFNNRSGTGGFRA